MSDIEKEEKTTELEKIENKPSKLRAFPQIFSYLDEEGSGYDLEIHLPGVDKDTIDLRMDKDSIYVTGETDTIRYVGSYGLCCPVDYDKATSTYKEGLLKLHVPFLEPTLKTIEVKIE